MAFERAVRSKLKLRLGIFGPSGSGKTYSALKIAKGIGGKIALCDSERGSSRAYHKIAEFDVDTMDKNTPEEYIEKIKDAVKAGYDVLILDSITHEWIQIKDSVDDITSASRSGNSYTAWKEPTKRHDRFVNAILQAPIHIICTMREKDETEMIANEKGKVEPVKIGFKPDQRKGLEYEFSTIFRLNRKHIAVAEKDRTELFDHFEDPLTEQVGAHLKEWLDEGVDTPQTKRASQEKKNFVFILLQKLNRSYDNSEVKQRFFGLTKKESMSFWSEADVDIVIEYLEKLIKEKHEASKAKPIEATKNNLKAVEPAQTATA